MRSTRRVEGYEVVKTGSNIAARYKESIGEVCEDAIIDPGCGRRALWCLAKELESVSCALTTGSSGHFIHTPYEPHQSGDQSTILLEHRE